jgi:flagellar hook-associated protein 3 FlgL
MAMRLTNHVTTDRVLADIQRIYGSVSRTTQQVSTGKRINKPSDDAVGAAEVRLRHADLAAVASHRDGVSAATSWLSATETGLSKIGDVLQRARELTLQAANGPVDQNSRDRIATEIDSLAEAAKDAVKVQMGGAYVFSGTATDTAPYAAGSDAYAGNAAAVVRDAGPNVPIQLNPQITPLNPPAPPASPSVPVTAGSILGGGTAAGDGRVLDALRDLAAHLRGGSAADLQALQSTDLQALDANMRIVNDARTAVGATQNRVDAASSRLDDLEDTTNKVLENVEGVDLAKALSDLSLQQTAYQAALRAGAQIIQPSLLDFLR